MLAAILIVGPALFAYGQFVEFPGFVGGNATSPIGNSVSTCSGTGLIFNVACNSQYIPTVLRP